MDNRKGLRRYEVKICELAGMAESLKTPMCLDSRVSGGVATLTSCVEELNP